MAKENTEIDLHNKIVLYPARSVLNCILHGTTRTITEHIFFPRARFCFLYARKKFLSTRNALKCSTFVDTEIELLNACRIVIIAIKNAIEIKQ